MMNRDMLGLLLTEILSPVVCALVDHSELVNLSVSGKDTVMVSVFVTKSDRGQIIGRQGKTAESLRTIVNAVAAKYRMRALLEIVEND